MRLLAVCFFVASSFLQDAARAKPKIRIPRQWPTWQPQLSASARLLWKETSLNKTALWRKHRQRKDRWLPWAATPSQGLAVGSSTLRPKQRPGMSGGEQWPACQRAADRDCAMIPCALCFRFYSCPGRVRTLHVQLLHQDMAGYQWTCSSKVPSCRRLQIPSAVWRKGREKNSLHAGQVSTISYCLYCIVNSAYYVAVVFFVYDMKRRAATRARLRGDSRWWRCL